MFARFAIDWHSRRPWSAPMSRDPRPQSQKSRCRASPPPFKVGPRPLSKVLGMIDEASTQNHRHCTTHWRRTRFRECLHYLQSIDTARAHVGPYEPRSEASKSKVTMQSQPPTSKSGPRPLLTETRIPFGVLGIIDTPSTQVVPRLRPLRGGGHVFANVCAICNRLAQSASLVSP